MPLVSTTAVSAAAPSPTLLPPALAGLTKIPHIPHLTTQQAIGLAWHLLPCLIAGVALALLLTISRRFLLGYWNNPQPEDGWRFWFYHIVKSIKPWFIWGIGVYMAVLLAEGSHKTIHLLFMAAFLLQLGLLLIGLLHHGAEHYLKVRHKGDSTRATVVSMLVLVGQLFIWLIIALMGMNTVGINVTAFLAGLGLGGIVIAMALKPMAEDIVGSMSIVFDRPFVLGDYITAGDFGGSVEKIGFKTTRLRAPTGEQLIIPNHDLLESRLRNYGRMTQRQMIFTISVDYGTPAEKLEKIPGWIKDAILAHEKTRVDRSHFVRYTPSSLDFETVYYVESGDYGLLMDIQQAVNLALYRKFRQQGIRFAHPMQSVRIASEEPQSEGRKKPGTVLKKRSKA